MRRVDSGHLHINGTTGAGNIVQSIAVTLNSPAFKWRETARRSWRAGARQEQQREIFSLMASLDKKVSRPHIPVMLPEVFRALKPVAGEVIIDATFGAGGYTKEFLEAGATVLAIDRDPNAIAAGQELAEKWDGKLILAQGRFSKLDALAQGAGFALVDGVVADIGVSSMQIDQAERGFSFQKDGPLDMRMEQAGVSAADVVNSFARSDLTRIIGILGEERQASRISAEIVERRDKKLFETTLDLAKCVEKVLGRNPKDRIHPATRTFQALRIFVNRELEELADALLAAERALKPGGCLVVVTFHSLEDRLVKKFMQDRAEAKGGSRHLPQVDTKSLTFRQIKRGAVSASSQESEINPRSRSAKLRSAIRTKEPAREGNREVFGLPRLAGDEQMKAGKVI